jgi:tetratricopeptide (TPR) repeat protein
MGEVYEAEDQELKERVALKTLLPEIASDEAMIARFKQEIQLSRRIGHPNVCRMFDLARDPADASGANGVYFLTMEFLPGETLSARLQREGRLTPAEALPLLDQMAEALDAAHRAGVIHRDLKPSNVMLVPGPQGLRAVVTDFGLARRQVAETDSTISMSGQLVGTWDYMAPELLAGAVASVASDVYALGMVAFRMVAGVLPFESIAPEAGAVLRARQAVPSPRAWAAELGPRWEGAILKALDRDPARRFSGALDFPRALRGEMSAITIAMPLMTRRRWAGASLAVLILAAGGLGWRAWVQARNRPSPEAAVLYRKGADDLEAGAFFAATKALGEAVKLAPGYALAHARLAEAWVELEMPERAGEEMLLARRQDSSGLPALERLQIEAVDLSITREYAAAAAKYEQATRQAGPENMETVMDLARAYEKAGKPDQAIEVYRRAAEGPAHNPGAWLRLGVLYGRQSDAAKSDEAFAQAERIYQLTSNLEGLTEVAVGRGQAANGRGQVERAAGFLKTALERARTAGNTQQEVRAKLLLSTNAYISGRTDQAEQLAREALDTAQTAQMESLAVRGLITLGNANLRGRDFAGAEKYLEEAHSMAGRNRSTRLAAFAAASLAALHEQTGNAEAASKEAQEALSFYEPNHFARESLQCVTILGRVAEQRGDYEAALSSYQHALKLAESVQDRYQMSLAHENIGSVLYSRENYPAALPEFREQLNLNASEEQAGYAAVHIGMVLLLLGRPADAAAMFDKADTAAAKFPSLRINLKIGRAEMALIRGEHREAQRLAREVLAQDPRQTLPTQSELMRILGLAALGAGARKEALEDCERSLAAALKLNDAGDILAARLALAEVQLNASQSAGALETLQQARPAPKDHPESRWRALALRTRVDPRSAPEARAALDELGRLWNDADALRTYRERPDIKLLERPLLARIIAKH